MNYAQARGHALAKGATDEEIDRQANNYVRQVGTIPFRNMITALQLHSWNNTCEQWTRLAAALKARSLCRKLNRTPSSTTATMRTSNSLG